MKKHVLRHVLTAVVSLGALAAFIPPTATADEQMKLPPARQIPGLTAEDKFANGCVDCHINMPDKKQDERISTLMSGWSKEADPKLLKKAQAVSPAGVKLKGAHPQVPASLKNIPAACAACHSKTSKTAPPLAALLHAIHLTGGGENHFLTIFQGECTHCHKFKAGTGVWTMPSGPEK